MGTLNFDQMFKILGLFGALASFVWGVVVWRDKAQHEREAAQREQIRVSESRRIEAIKPFLERQLTLYTEATQMAEIMATSDNRADLVKAPTRFWRLYWGELAMVEDQEVEKAMKHLGDAVRASASQPKLAQLSLELAHACRFSLDRAWGINVWTAHSTVREEWKGEK